MTGVGMQLDPTLRSTAVEDFERDLRCKIIGQNTAIDAVVDIYQMFTAKLNPPFRPVGNLLFLGPTGTGKTHVVETIAKSLFGDERALIKIDCAEFQHSHEIAKLIGSPPGYLGHRETHPVLNQEAINQHHTKDLQLTLLLFDEIEKASDALWQLLLGILDKGTLTLGDNRHVDLSCCIIVMTSNIGAKEMSALTTGGLGFRTTGESDTTYIDPDIDTKIEHTALESARRKFTPEFMNRIDKTVVFKTLRQDHLEQILELELNTVQKRVLQAVGGSQFVFSCNNEVKKHLLQEGTDPKYGARHLKRVIERSIVFPLANLIATQQINIGDFISIAFDHNKKLIFTVESKNPPSLAVTEFIGRELPLFPSITTPVEPSPSPVPSPILKRIRKKLTEEKEEKQIDKIKTHSEDTKK